MAPRKVKPLFYGRLINFCGYIFPSGLIFHILSHLEPKQLIQLSLVNKQWYLLVRNKKVWMAKYMRTYRKPAKTFPWFVYYTLFATDFFDTNLLKNSSGSEGFNHWNVSNASRPTTYLEIDSTSHEFNQIPRCVPDFEGVTSCFNFVNKNCLDVYTAAQSQTIILSKSKCCDFILEYFKPHIEVSEWITYTGGSDCYYFMIVIFREYDDDDGNKIFNEVHHTFLNEERGVWIKRTIIINDYPKKARSMSFYHSSLAYPFPRNFSAKMAGGIVKILFDSMQSQENNVELLTALYDLGVYFN